MLEPSQYTETLELTSSRLSDYSLVKEHRIVIRLALVGVHRFYCKRRQQLSLPSPWPPFWEGEYYRAFRVRQGVSRKILRDVLKLLSAVGEGLVSDEPTQELLFFDVPFQAEIFVLGITIVMRG